jgi:hypothetical protein
VHNLKPFDPNDVDESLLRLVTYGGKHYALFPFVDATGALPEFRSVRYPIQDAQLTAGELSELAHLIRQRGASAAWFIQFSTPWLIQSAAAAQGTPTEKRAR